MPGKTIIKKMITEKEKSKIKRAVNKQLLSFKDDIVIVVDTREQQLCHILDYFNRQQINYIEQKLDTGDYSFIYQGEDYSSIFSVDRKKDTNEFVGNFFESIKDENGKKKASLRFNNELERARLFKYFSFCIEEGSMADIYNGKYVSRVHANAAIGRLETIKNNIQIDFIQSIEFGEYLINKIYYWIRSELIQQEILRLENENELHG